MFLLSSVYCELRLFREPLLPIRFVLTRVTDKRLDRV